MLSLSTYSPEKITSMSMIEVAYEILQEERQAINIYELVKKVAEIKGLSKEEVEDRIAQFYTDINIDGRFICLGENLWGLRIWYPYEQIDDDISQITPTKKKKKKKKDEDEDDYDLDVDDEYDDSDEDYSDDDDEDYDDDDDDDDDSTTVNAKDDSDDDLTDDDYDDDMIDEDEFSIDEDDEELDDEEDEELEEDDDLK